MAQVTIERNDEGGWHIHFPVSDEDFIDLPADSERYEAVDDMDRDVIRYGTEDIYLQTIDDPFRSFSYKTPGYGGYVGVMVKTARGRDTTNAQRDAAFEQLEAAWDAALGVEEEEEEEHGEAAAIAQEQADIAQDEAIRSQEAANTSEAGIGLMSRSSSQATTSSEPGETGGRRKTRKTRKSRKSRKNKKRKTRRAKKASRRRRQ